MSTAQLSPGTVVDGRFTIGAATWARTGAQSYAATDERGQAVVLTAYVAACFSSGLMLERSLRELRQLQALQSPRVAVVHTCGKLADGGIYEVVAALPGTRLDALVARGALPGPDAADIIEQVGEGLLEAQKTGVIHRNLGPRVVFVGPSGAVVTGFSVGEPHGDKSFGPLDTIAPEQVEGKVVDQRTLIYNLAALMHMLITGAPLFAGDAASQLAAHLGREAQGDVHARLRRALGKDPRMRPMMLKQFLAELRAIGGAAARAPIAPSTGGDKAPPLPGGDLSTGTAAAKPGGAPSSRGWTMFMQGEGQEAPAAAGAGAGAPAASPAPTSDAPAKPKTRGWTMFMDGADDEAKAKPEDKPAAKPSTRGWTMFMKADEEAAAEAVALAEPVAPRPAVPPVAAPPAVAPPAVAPPVVAPPPVAPSVAARPVAAPPVAAPPVAAASAPKSRGWTMFTEASDDVAAEAVAAAEASAAPPIEAAPAPGAPAVAQGPASKPGRGDADAPAKKRGWTMFMDKPLPETKGAKPDPLGGVVPSSGESNAKGWTVFSPAADVSAEPPGEPPPAEWPPSERPVAAPVGQAMPTPIAALQPAVIVGPRSKTSGQTTVPADDAGARAQAAADDDRLRAKTLVVTGPPDVSPSAHPNTMVTPPGSSPAAPPRVITVVSTEPPLSSPLGAMNGEPSEPSEPLASRMSAPPPGSMSIPSGAVSSPVATGLSGPISTGMTGPISTGMARQSGSDAMMPAKKKSGSPVVLIVVGVALVAAVIVGVIVMLDS